MEHETCRHLLGSLSDYVDGELAEDLCAEIKRHMSTCENCRVVVDTLQKTIYLVHETASHPDMPEEVRQRLLHRLDLDDFVDRKA